jgi:HK97 family phage portal protein
MLRNSTSPYLGDALAESYSTSLSLIAGTCSIVSQINSNASHVEAIISTETPLTGAQMNELRQAYDRQASAAQGKLGGVVIMSAGMKPSSIRRLPTALEADVANVMNFSVAEASRITGVPLGLLGVKDSNAYNSAVEAQRAFYRSTLRPLFHRIEAELSAKLGANLKFDSVELTLGSGQERAETISKLLYCGAISLDEARTALGYGKTPGGDVHGVPANQVPLPAWLKTPIPQAALAPTKTKKTEL